MNITDIAKYVIIVAGGKGNRMGSNIPKQFLSIGNEPILMRTIRKFHEAIAGIQIVVVLPANQLTQWETLCQQHHFILPHQIAIGGNTRFYSVKNGLALIGESGLVAIHDGVRPFVSQRVIVESFLVAAQSGNAIVAVSPKDSIRVVNQDGGGSYALDRASCKLIQTPQTFRVELIKKAYQVDFQELFTDDASVAEFAGEKIHLVEGEYTNIKITTPEDIKIAETLIS